MFSSLGPLRGRLLVGAAGGGALALAAVLAVAMAAGVGGAPLGDVDSGFETAADFTLPTFDGDTFTLSDHAEGPIFIYFWASWCAPCREEAPLIERLWPEYRRAGYTFVGVNILDAREDALAFIAEFDITFPNVYDDTRTVYLEYGVYGIPEAFFLRPGQLVNQKYLGPLKEDGFREMLEALLPDGAPPG